MPKANVSPVYVSPIGASNIGWRLMIDSYGERVALYFRRRSDVAQVLYLLARYWY